MMKVTLIYSRKSDAEANLQSLAGSLPPSDQDVHAEYPASNATVSPRPASVTCHRCTRAAARTHVSLEMTNVRGTGRA